MESIAAYFLSSSFIAGAVVYFAKKYIDRRARLAEEKRIQRDKDEEQFRLLTWQCENTQKELLLQIHRGIQKQDRLHEFYNGEYRAAFEAYMKAVAEKDKFVQTIFVHNKF